MLVQFFLKLKLEIKIKIKKEREEKEVGFVGLLFPFFFLLLSLFLSEAFFWFALDSLNKYLYIYPFRFTSMYVEVEKLRGGWGGKARNVERFFLFLFFIF